MNFNDVRNKVKRNRTIFFTYKKITDHDYRTNFRDYLEKSKVKSEDTVRKETSLIENYWRCDPMHYYRYRLFEKDLSTDELLDYIPSYYFYNHYMPSVYDNSAILAVTESKISMNEYFRKKDIATPVTVAIIRDCLILDTTGERLSWNDLVQKMEVSGSTIFFVKPDAGKGGAGIFTIKKTTGKLLTDKEILDEKLFSIRTRDKDFIIQEGILQRGDIREVNPSSVNTLRVITQKRGDEFRISAVVLRVGRNGSVVDNSAQGGISVNVNIENGTFEKYAVTEHTNERFDKHPDTGFSFEGFQIKEWDSIKHQILDYASRATEFPDVAWDIAVLENSISVIEINVNYGIDHLQCCIGGMRRKLNIKPKHGLK